MVSVDNGKDEIEECNNGSITKEFDSIDISSSRRTLVTGENPGRKFPGTLNSIPNRISFLNLGSASAKFKRLATQMDQASQAVPTPSSRSIRERFSGMFAKKLDWGSIKKMSVEWIRNPMNMALFAWILCVAVSGAILFLVMTGMLNGVLKKSQRNAWFEVNNQILNALFTLMCLYNHPKRFYHLVLLCRWSPKDIIRLRNEYCKNGTYKPHEWMHMMVVVILFHLNCFAQYALCGLNWGYKRSQRPAIGVGICISFAIGAPAIAGLYTILSPLGRDYDSGTDEESQVQISATTLKQEQMRMKSFEKKYSFASRDQQRTAESRPQWSGGILDIWDDISQAYLSLFCTFCVFGWNMERLGFGNMYVHIATFMLFCMAPFWIFILAAVNIEDDTVRQALVGAGIVLCFFGLLYGGFWRIQMRKRYNLPTYDFCFGKPSVSDCTLWLCCCWCSLAQEVRTADAYNIVEDKFFSKEIKTVDQLQISPLHREGVTSTKPDTSSPLGVNSSPSTFKPSSPLSSSSFFMGYRSPEGPLSSVKEELSEKDKEVTMNPPTPPLIQRQSP
ncbi:uncharacterized protein [Cicer arietinum]|uniref:Uncharacterized protein LOC101492050 n=1 Tax=Cicer arietinum TaxID=3827 RepID=A0A1S2XL72_CICAR|nr:uncharacterized protein LOC101492050 [Cicer arietinum]